MFPEVQLSSPLMSLASVLFPAPEYPMMPKISPGLDIQADVLQGAYGWIAFARGGIRLGDVLQRYEGHGVALLAEGLDVLLHLIQGRAQVFLGHLQELGSIP